MLSEVREIVENGHLGVRTYEQFVQACLQRTATAGNDDTVALFVLAKIVQPFADYYFDQALSEPLAVAFRQRILTTIADYEAAGSIEEKQAVLTRAIREDMAEA